MIRGGVLVDDPLFLAHHAAGSHPERPERLHAMRRAVDRAANVLKLAALAQHDATSDELARVHTDNYIDLLGRSAGDWGQLDADTYLSPQSVAAARRAAGGAVALAQALCSGRANCGVALLRPPGHHARPDSAMGFCLLNNVALAAAHARALGAERVLVLDWDVHHGNGTQEAFYDDPSVLFISLHQSPYYPGSGSELEAGDGEGRGFTVNLPLVAGAGNAVYFAAFERIVLPIVAQYRPTLTLISAGFDAHERDPLGGMQLTDAAYFRLARELMRTLGPDAPVGVVTEGGYDLAALEGSLWSTLQALGGAELPVSPEVELTAAQDREIRRLEIAAGAYWRLG